MLRKAMWAFDAQDACESAMLHSATWRCALLQIASFFRRPPRHIEAFVRQAAVDLSADPRQLSLSRERWRRRLLGMGWQRVKKTEASVSWTLRDAFEADTARVLAVLHLPKDPIFYTPPKKKRKKPKPPKKTAKQKPQTPKPPPTPQNFAELVEWMDDQGWPWDLQHAEALGVCNMIKASLKPPKATNAQERHDNAIETLKTKRLHNMPIFMVAHKQAKKKPNMQGFVSKKTPQTSAWIAFEPRITLEKAKALGAKMLDDYRQRTKTEWSGFDLARVTRRLLLLAGCVELYEDEDHQRPYLGRLDWSDLHRVEDLDSAFDWLVLQCPAFADTAFSSVSFKEEALNALLSQQEADSLLRRMEQANKTAGDAMERANRAEAEVARLRAQIAQLSQHDHTPPKQRAFEVGKQ